MIYLTVGTYPHGFNRLVKAIDNLCEKHDVECIAQTGRSAYKPVHMQHQEFFAQEEHLNNIKNAKFIITHGGFGIIGDIMRLKKPMIIAPRKLNEGPNDQMEMAKRISATHNIPLCLEIDNIEPQFIDLLNLKENTISYQLDNDVSSIISAFLKTN